MKTLCPVRTIILAGSLLLQLNTLCFHSRGAAGDVDLPFSPSFDDGITVNTVAVQLDGKVMIGGEFFTVNGLARRVIARLNADGNVDATFAVADDPNANLNAVSAIALQSNGKVLVGDVHGIFRFNSNGTPDTSFIQPTIVDEDVRYAGVGSIVVQSDGKILIGGFFAFVNDALREGIARLNADGSLDRSFDPGLGLSAPYGGAAESIAVQPDGKVLIGGNFVFVNDTARHGIARLNANGSLDTTFDPGTGVGASFGEIASLVLQPNGKVLIGGTFNNFNGTNRNSLARLNADGSVDSSFNPGSGLDGGFANYLALQSDGKVLVGGEFRTINGTNRNNFARLNADGSVDGSFNPGTAASQIVLSIALQSDGKALIGGYSNSPILARSPYVARLYGDSAPSLNIARSNAFVIVSWPSPSTGFVLQQNTDLTTTHWTTPAEAITDNGTTRFITVNPTPGNRFYRLFKP